MVRYGLAAAALKAFSLTPATKRAYRRIGNAIGARRRQNASLETYVARGNLLVELYVRYASQRPGATALELGTGWMHWYATYLRLFADVRITTMDVWDNRQFAAFKACFARLQQRMDRKAVPASAFAALQRIAGAQDFDDVYAVLGFEHVIVPDGSLARFADAAFASVFSMHVLEHVAREAVPALAGNLYRVLRPGGVMIHQIGIDDHLAHYDPAASRKQYLAYSERAWRRFFDNEIQYINRLQMSDWIRSFKQAGFVLLDRRMEKTSLAGLRIDPAFSGYGRDDLASTIVTLVMRRP